MLCKRSDRAVPSRVVRGRQLRRIPQELQINSGATDPGMGEGWGVGESGKPTPTPPTACTVRGDSGGIPSNSTISVAVEPGKIISASAKPLRSSVAGGSGRPIPSSEVKAYQYTMTGHAEGCVERYLELANRKVQSLSRVATRA